MKTIGGTIIIRNAISQDYCILEAIQSLIPICDEIIVGDCGSDDGTTEYLNGLSFPSSVKIETGLDWNVWRGKYRLPILTNFLKNKLKTDYHFSLQADEVLHEDSYMYILDALGDEVEGALVQRYNLWGSSKTMVRLDLEGRKPVSDKVIRLAKKRYQSYGDAESLEAPFEDYTDRIKIFHMGFIRDKKKHVDKIIQMQRDVFCIGPDPRVLKMKEAGDVFNPGVFFSPEDLQPAPPLPQVIRRWAEERDK